MEKDDTEKDKERDEITKKANAAAMEKLAPFTALNLTDWGVFEEALNIMAGVPKKKLGDQ